MGMTEETRSENIDRLRAEQAARSALPAEAQRQSRSAKDADFLNYHGLFCPHLLMAAWMRSGHVHAAALPLHLKATGALGRRHLGVRQRAGHRRRKRPDQQQYQRTELARTNHRNLSILHRSRKVHL